MEVKLDITEKQFSKQLEDLFKLFGWKYSHTYEQTHYARRSTKGFPDYVAVRDGLIIFAELKSEKGKLTEEQEAWIKELGAVEKHSLGVMVFVWRPSDINKIVEILR